MNHTDIGILVILVHITILAQSLVLAHLTYTAYRRSGGTDLRTLSISFISILVGVLGAGIVFALFDAALLVALLVESVFFAIGLGIMIYSLYGYR